MSQVLTVPTHFNDIGELSDGFLDRVENDTLILYGPVAYEEGAEIEFAVLLADGTPALEGAGRVRAAVDGGADRVPETRYDVVLETLQLDGRSEVVFERLVIDRQSVSEPPPPPSEEAVVAEDAPVADEVEATANEADDDEDFEMTVESLSPDLYDEDFDEEDPPTVLKEVDPDTLGAMTEDTVSVADEAEAMEEAIVADDAAEALEAAEVEEVEQVGEADEPRALDDEESEAVFETPLEHEGEVAAVLANATATEIAIEGDEDAELGEAESIGHVDSMYAFEHGIADEPKVGMPVPMPSMAAPPVAPPAPPRLRLAEPPQGLTRPSLSGQDGTGVQVDDEVSDVHHTGMFAYEGRLPIPERPPLPDPNRAKQIPPVEAANDYDVQDSESAELISDGYEEVRLSDFAEAVEEG